MVSPSSSGLICQVEHGIHHKKQKPEWLEAFLPRTFFGSCPIHQDRKNELNKYCINCGCSACQYCISSGFHCHHKLLKIYRHVYKDVIPLSDMEKHINCSKIQPYKSNKQLVVALNPLPHCGSISNIEVSCHVCRRRLSEPDLYCYCSIACKVKAFSRMLSDSVPPFLSVQTPTEEKQKQALKAEKPLHKRKGKPHRAPLF